MRRLTPLASLLLVFAAPAQDPLIRSRLEGRVVDPLHEPVPNAEVVIEHDGIVVATTRSDGDGAFVFPRVPAQFVTVRATTEAPDIGAALVDLWGEGRGFVLVRTGPARRLTGVVRDDRGDPIAGAWVGASPLASMPRSLSHCSGRTDAEGRYELTHVAMGEVQVRAWTAVNDSDAFDGVADGAGDAELDCTVAAGQADWWTFVLENADAEQLARAELRLMAFHSGRHVPLPPELARPRPAEPGRWEVRGWNRADSVHAWVVLDGATMWPGQHVIARGAGTTKRRFRVGDDESRIRGVLRRPDGGPAAGVAILAQPLSGVAGINTQRRAAVSGEDGAFTLQSPVAPAARFAMRSMSPATVLAGNDPNPVWFVANHDPEEHWRLDTRPACSVRFRLEDAAGNPGRGVHATLSVVEGAGERVIGTGVTGLDGTARIGCLGLALPARLRVSAFGPDGLGSFEIAAPAGFDVDVGRLRLGPSASLRVVLSDPEGVPLAGARIQIYALDHRRQSPFPLTSDRDGRFLVRGLVPGRYRVSVHGGRRWHHEILAVNAGDRAELDITVPK